jgi:hypothetical protein
MSSSSSVARWLSRGDLVLLHPGVLALPDRAAEWSVRAHGAMLWAAGPLSHLSALAVAGLVGPPSGPLHVTVPVERCPRGIPDVIAHRSNRCLVTIRRESLEAVEPIRSVVDAWSWAHSPTRNPTTTSDQAAVRQAVIEGARTHGIRVPALRRESERRPRHPGHARLTTLLGLVADGCESELEIWGVTHVLPGPPDAPTWTQQHPVCLPDGGWVRLDAAYPEARVAVELDGAAFHGSRTARERDLRRDSALAALGWIVLRFSYARLMADPEGCRMEIATVVARRLANR